MILKGSQRAGAAQLAAHLLNDRDNDHIRVHELRGFAADDLHGALTEAHAISRGTKCQQFLFSLSLNPPKGADASEGDFEKAADAAERALGLDGQPRAIVIHEKEGRRHAHVVWSRIDAREMRAVNMAHFKRKLQSLSRELYLEHGWELPNGLRSDGGKNPLNFTLDEWQKAKRLGVDPREIKDALRAAWLQSDDAKALRHALEARGFFLAAGDRRSFVVVDLEAQVHALSKAVGVKERDVRAKLGDPTGSPSVESVKRDVAALAARQLKGFTGELRQNQAQEMRAARKPLDLLVAKHRAERARLDTAQAVRWKRESAERARKTRKGWWGLFDLLTGKRSVQMRRNEAHALACLRRDRAQRDTLVLAQLRELTPLQRDFDRLRERHKYQRADLIRELVRHHRAARERDRQTYNPEPTPRRRRRRGPSLSL